MYAPRVFVSMMATLIVFAIGSYWISGSFYTTIIQTVLCAIIIQAGYFAGVVYLVRRETLKAREAAGADDAVAGRQRDALRASGRDELRTRPAGRMTAPDA